MPRSKEEAIGTQFCRLTLIDQFQMNGATFGSFRCVCGTVKTLKLPVVRAGRITSCGCLKRAIAGAKNKTHGLSRSKEYRSWFEMLERCRNPEKAQFDDYGGRGITVCERWMQFAPFYADMGPKPSRLHTLDRIDNDGPYTPENCRWATRQVQRNNQRRSKVYTFNHVSGSLKDLARHFGLSYSMLHQRISTLGWPLHKAMTIPKQR